MSFVKPVAEVEEFAFFAAEGEVGQVGSFAVMERLATMAAGKNGHGQRFQSDFFACGQVLLAGQIQKVYKHAIYEETNRIGDGAAIPGSRPTTAHGGNA